MISPSRSPWPGVAKPVIGMIHLPPLLGSPRFNGDLQAVSDAAVRDAEALVEGGVHGLMIENYGDAPFFAGRVPAETVAHMTDLTAEVQALFPDTPVGLNVLRNDGLSALAIAAATGAWYIRVNILCGARLTDQGVIHGIAAELLRQRAFLAAEHILILADVNVKHSAPIGPGSFQQDVVETIGRGGADMVIVTGSMTGTATPIDQLQAAKQAAGRIPVLVGSGVGPDTIDNLMPLADGFIVGSSLKVNGVTTNPVDPQRVRALMRRVR